MCLKGLIDAGQLRSGSHYQLLLILNVDAMALPDAEQLTALRKAGQSLVFHGSTPQQVSGYLDAEHNDRQLQLQMRQLLIAGAEHIGIIDVLSQRLAAQPHGSVQLLEPENLRTIRRRVDDVDIRFLANPLPEPSAANLHLDPGVPHWWYDASTGDRWPVTPVNGIVSRQLAGLESLFLISGRTLPPRETQALCRPNGASLRQELTEWHIPELNNRPLDWREVDTQASRITPVAYTARFDVENASGRFSLDLGLLQGIARITVNSQPAGLVAVPPFQLDIGEFITAGTNKLRVEVVPAQSLRPDRR